MKKRIDWFGCCVVFTVLLWVCWGALANAAPRVAGNVLILHSQDSGTFPTPGVMNFNGILGDIDGGLWTQDGRRGWVRICTDVNGLGCADAGTVKVVTGTLPLRVVNDGGGGYDISLDTSVLDAGLVKVITATLPVIATSDAGGGYDISLRTAACTGTYAALQYDAGFYCAQLAISIPDSGYVSVTGDSPIRVVNDAGGGFAVSLTPGYITGIAPIVATSDGGGGYAIGMSTAACTGTYAALQYDAGFYCAQLAINIPDSGYVSVTGTYPITVTPDAGGGYDVSIDTAYTKGGFWSFFCPSGVSCNDQTTPMLSVSKTKTGAWLMQEVSCNASVAGITGTMTFHVAKVVSGVTSDVDTCTMTCSAVTQTGSSCTLSQNLLGTVEYKSYVTGCTTYPTNLWCNISLTAN